MLAVATAGAAAAPAAARVGAHAPAGPGLIGGFFALVLVLGLILGLAWLLKRMPGGGFRQAEGLRIVASLQLGAKERAVVVQVGDEQLLLGVGPGTVSALHRLAQPLPEAPAPQMPQFKKLPEFSQLLAQRLRKGS
ncbi:flagellar biosynthetic protein FliO [Luteimonas sp. RD2P54]|uniref:Flagellar protein n=1 Tax=Luteimonas endophytica TaxID=3042023 RepID=A0ABT6J990_9GAMM|nr:flagellar biosynthetic protein FliO [Luteimonas endophytica]MDH5822773.1 flagellar biosynthetic protein FliO [Luteimonas endophytica]